VNRDIEREMADSYLKELSNALNHGIVALNAVSALKMLNARALDETDSNYAIAGTLSTIAKGILGFKNLIDRAVGRLGVMQSIHLKLEVELGMEALVGSLMENVSLENQETMRPILWDSSQAFIRVMQPRMSDLPDPETNVRPGIS
jgi:hypothetical protein